MDQEKDEKRPLLRPVNTQDVVPVDDLQRAEEPEVGALDQATTLVLNAAVEQALNPDGDDPGRSLRVPCTADEEGFMAVPGARLRATAAVALAASAVALLGGARTARAETAATPGWAGYITVSEQWASSEPGATSSHVEHALYTLDGSLASATSAGPLVWSQQAKWTASYLDHIRQGTCSEPPDSPPVPFVSTTSGEGSGTGTAHIEFTGPDADGRWHSVVSAVGPAGRGIETTTTATCGGSMPGGPVGPYPASSTYGGGTHLLPIGAAPAATMTLSGSLTAHGVSNGVDTVTVTWHLTRFPDPWACSNGLDDDGDGYADYAGGVPGLGDPGCDSNEDDDESNASGRIIVQAETLPAGSGAGFEYLGSLSGIIGDGETLALDVEPGSYVVHEALKPGWRVESVSCDDADSTGDSAGRAATFVVSAGETVRCVFTHRTFECGTATPAWSARMLAPPFLRLFRFQASFTYCWDGERGTVLNGASFGNVETGVAPFVQELAGNEFEFVDLGGVTIDGDTAVARGAFVWRFSILSLANALPGGLGFRAVTEKFISQAIRHALERELRKIIPRFGYGSDARAAIADALRRWRLLSEEIVAKEAARAERTLAKLIGGDLASIVTTSAAARLNGNIKETYESLYAGLSSDQFAGWTSDQISDWVADRMAAKMYEALSVDLHLWTPTVTFVVGPNGETDTSIVSDHYFWFLGIDQDDVE